MKSREIQQFKTLLVICYALSFSFYRMADIVLPEIRDGSSYEVFCINTSQPFIFWNISKIRQWIITLQQQCHAPMQLTYIDWSTRPSKLRRFTATVHINIIFNVLRLQVVPKARICVTGARLHHAEPFKLLCGKVQTG
jgi:hypothetical protein